MRKMIQIDEKAIKNNLINLKHIIFEVTEKCNLNCKYCGLSDQLYKKYHDRSKRDLPFRKAKLMIDYLINLWRENTIMDTNFRFAVGFYGGEPLMNIKLIREIINYIDQSEITGRQILYSMTTNAMLLDKYMDFLAENKFNLLISLDGDEKSQGYRIDTFSNNSFKQVMRNIQLLQYKYPEYFSESVNFNSVLHNLNDIEPIIDFFKTQFNKLAKISLLNSSGIADEKKEDFRKMYQNMSQSLMKSPNCQAIEEEFFLETPKGYSISRYLYNASGNIFYNYNQLFMQKLIDNEISTGTCTPFSKKLFVSADGKILPCERIDHDFKVGYIHDDFVELDYQFVADRHSHFLSKSAKQCMSCASNKYCPQCIYYIDDIRNTTSHCSEFCTTEKYKVDKQRIFSYLRLHPHYYEKVLNEVSFTI